jgi:hypothetical protein
MTMPTLGQQRVRATFNPSKASVVDDIKGATAALIDLCEDAKSRQSSGEEGRLWALAQTMYEDAAMWAVKAATTPRP